MTGITAICDLTTIAKSLTLKIPREWGTVLPRDGNRLVRSTCLFNGKSVQARRCSSFESRTDDEGRRAEMRFRYVALSSGNSDREERRVRSLPVLCVSHVSSAKRTTVRTKKKTSFAMKCSRSDMWPAPRGVAAVCRSSIRRNYSADGASRVNSRLTAALNKLLGTEPNSLSCH